MISLYQDGGTTPADSFYIIDSDGNALATLDQVAIANLYWKPNEPNDGKATTAGPEDGTENCIALVNNNDGLVGAQDVECFAADLIYQPLCQYGNYEQLLHQ